MFELIVYNKHPHLSSYGFPERQKEDGFIYLLFIAFYFKGVSVSQLLNAPGMTVYG